MPYKRSTQTQGFRGRKTYDPSKDLEKKAKALDNKRIEEVKGYEKAANQQLTEMQRIDNVLKGNDAFEVKMLAENSQHFKNALKASTEFITKKAIDDGRQKGIDLHRAAQAGDEEAKAKIDLSEKQVKEIELKMANLDDEVTKALNFDPAKHKLSLEEQMRAENIRKLGRNVAYGYQTAAMKESAEGYLAWFIDQPTNADSAHYNDEFSIKIGDEEVALKVSDYNKYTNPVKQKAIEDYLEFEYIKANTPDGMRSQVVDKYLTSDVVKQTNKYRINKFKENVQTTAQQEIRDRSVKFYNLVEDLDVLDRDDDPKTFSANEQLLKKSFENMFAVGSNAHFRAGTGNEGPNIANKKQIIEDIKVAYALLDDEGRLLFDDFLTNTKINIPGLGQQTITEWGKGVFDLDTIRAEALEKSISNAMKLDKAESDMLKIEGTDLKSKLNNSEDGYDQTQFDADVAVLFDKYGHTTGWYSWAATNLKGYKPEYTSLGKARIEAVNYQEEYGFIPRHLIEHWPANAREEFKDQIDDKSWLFTDQANEQIKDFKQAYHDELSSIAQTLTIFKGATNSSLTNRIKFAQAKLLPLASKLETIGHKDADGNGPPPGAGKLWYLQEAHKIILTEINTYDNKDSEFYWDTSKNQFKKGVVKSSTKASEVDEKLVNLALSKTEAKKLITSKNGDVLGTTLINSHDTSVYEPLKTGITKLNPNGEITGYHPFVIELANMDPYDRTPFEIMNLQRSLAGMEPIPLEQLPIGEQKLQKLLEQTYPEVRKLFKAGDVRSFTRAMDQLGLVEVKGMTDAMIQMTDGEIISQGELPSLLTEMNISNDEYENSPDVQLKVQRYKVNKFLKLASTQTNNRAEMIRRAAIGIKFGEDQMDNWGEGSIDDLGDTNMNNFSLRTYNTYLTGTKDTIKGDSLGATVEVVTPTIENQIINRPLNTRDVISIKLENLQSNEPEQMIQKPISRTIPWPLENAGEQQVTYKRVYNPAHAKWKKDIQIAENHLALLDLFDNKEALSSIWWGTRMNPQSTEAQYMLRSVLGKDVMNEIYEQAANNVGRTNFLEILTTFKSDSKLHGPFAREVERLLMERPELQSDFVGVNN